MHLLGRLLIVSVLLKPTLAVAVEEYTSSGFISRNDWGTFLYEVVRSIDGVTLALVVFFLILLGMCFDLLIHLRLGKLIPDSLLNNVQGEMANGEYEKAFELCQNSESLIGHVFASALVKTDYSFERMAGAMRVEVAIQGLVWRQWVAQFRTTAWLGLIFGCIGFLIECMRFIADLAGRPNVGLALASSFETRSFAYSGFSALLLGLLMAAISLAVATMASAKLEKILLEAERLGEELLDPFRPLPLPVED